MQPALCRDGCDKKAHASRYRVTARIECMTIVQISIVCLLRIIAAS
jgi:hypothetical protein